MGSKQKRVGIIGAGVSGLLAIKYCLEEGLTPVCFEQHDKIGGTWYYTEHERENQTASVYQNMAMNDIKERMTFSDFPAPDHYPQFLRHFQYHEYLQSYVKHFDLERHIGFNQTVMKVKKARNYDTTGQWEVFTKSSDAGVEERQVFDAIALCSGAYSHGYMPTLPGQSDFKGTLIHSTQYRKPEDFAGQNVLVVGGRFSATDQAADLVGHAKQVYWGLRRGTHVLPKIINGRCYTLGQPRHEMLTTPENIGKSWMDIAAKHLNHAEYGIETNENPLLEGDFALSDEVVPGLLTGKIKVVRGLESFTEDSVVLADGTSLKMDAVIMATGYETDFRFVDCPDINADRPAEYMLYKGVFPVNSTHPTLAVLSSGGFLGSYTLYTELAARWVARIFVGESKLPSRKELTKDANARREHYNQRCGERKQFSEFLVAEDLASEIGVRPDLYRIIFWDPALAYKVYYGPPIPAHYRLVGPGAQKSAAARVHQIYDWLHPIDISNKLKSVTWCGVIGGFVTMAAYAALAYGGEFMEKM